MTGNADSVVGTVYAKPSRHQALALAVLLVAILLRVGLTLTHRDFNDDHMVVVERILRGENTSIGHCWECFHPKMYHMAVAHLIRLFGVQDRSDRILLGQFLNLAAGLLTLWFVATFVRERCWGPTASLLTLSLLVLNPKLIGINAQATNDSFVIAFGVLSTHLVVRSFSHRNLWLFAGGAAAAILAASAKGTGLVVGLALAVTLCLRAIGRRESRWRWAFTTLGFVLCFLLTVPFLGSYYQNYRLAGSPFAINIRKPDPAAFEETAQMYRPGIRDIPSGYFTFRLASMLQHPYMHQGKQPSQLHRTSFWSLLYGCTHSLRFAQWPPSWRSRDVSVLALGRAALILALLPAGVLLLGIWTDTRKLVGRARVEGVAVLAESEWFLRVLFFGALAYLLKFTHDYRDFSAVKAIYLMPCLLAYGWYLGAGLERCDRWLASRPYLRVPYLTWFATLLVVYTFDAAVLISHLA